MNTKNARADLAAMRATMDDSDRRNRALKAISALRLELHGIATVEVHRPSNNCLVITVHGLPGDAIGVSVKKATTVTGAIGSVF